MPEPALAAVSGLDSAHAQVLHDEVVVHPVGGALAPAAGLSDAAERRAFIRTQAACSAD